MIALTPCEKDMLAVFRKYPGEVLSRSAIARLTGRPPRYADKNSRTIDMCISRVRKALAGTPERIKAVYNKGYVYCPGGQS